MSNSSQPKPIIQAMVIADHVYQDKVTDKFIVTGIFGRLRFQKQAETKSQSGPNLIVGGMHAGSPFLYLCMVELRGMYQFQLRYVNLGTDQVIFYFDFGIECNDPLVAVELPFGLPPLPAIVAGTFALELLWNQEPIGSVRIVVEEIPVKGLEDVSGSEPV